MIGLLEAARRDEAEKRREEDQQKKAGKTKARATPKPGPKMDFLPKEAQEPKEEKSREEALREQEAQEEAAEAERKLQRQQEENEDRRREDHIYDNARRLLAEGKGGTGKNSRQATWPTTQA